MVFVCGICFCLYCVCELSLVDCDNYFEVGEGCVSVVVEFDNKDEFFLLDLLWGEEFRMWDGLWCGKMKLGWNEGVDVEV